MKAQILNLRHIAIVVSDIEKATQFYCGIGCQLMSTDEESGSFISHLLALIDCKLLTCKLKLPDGSRIELIEFVKPTLEIQANIQRNDTVFGGIHHLAFTVSDIDSFVSLTLKLGGFLISSPTSVPKEHSINAVPALHCYVSDPFGNLIHLAQDI